MPPVCHNFIVGERFIIEVTLSTVATSPAIVDRYWRSGQQLRTKCARGSDETSWNFNNRTLFFFGVSLIFFETDIARARNHILVRYLRMQNSTGTTDAYLRSS